MNILVIGVGGREDALICTLQNSVFVKRITQIPIPVGMANCSWCKSDMVTGMSSVERMANLSKNNAFDFVVISAEVDLISGVADVFRNKNIPVFGPSKCAVEIAGSKISCKLFCNAHGIPTPDFSIAETPQQAEALLERYDVPVDVKADGLTSGRSVVVAYSKEEALLVIKKFSQLPGGRRLLLERVIFGRECSYQVFTDGMHILPLPSTRDYKTVFVDSFVNTGGMGCVTLTSDEFSHHLETKK